MSLFLSHLSQFTGMLAKTFTECYIYEHEYLAYCYACQNYTLLSHLFHQIRIQLAYFIHQSECRIVPSPGRCRDMEKSRSWSYSTKIGSCTELYGCYGIRDRNVFKTRTGCERNCYITDANDPSARSYLGMYTGYLFVF